MENYCYLIDNTQNFMGQQYVMHQSLLLYKGEQSSTS